MRRNVGIALPHQVERIAVEILDHAELRERAPAIDGIERVFIAGEEDDCGKQLLRKREQAQVGLKNDAESAFRAAKQVDPVHVRA